ncbi:hypothetical protein CYMTET_56249 [Cymbomonas tetramitiformis]|uniref:Uncharacterized protein n=1 Tax=Cymbomonas tetramitiformis TaxID=36881 RepID=A0AAE0BCS0_9CHLO|nr:hypothetical protein CYMTET_56249 [Cymbomonas tetramitiformis]
MWGFTEGRDRLATRAQGQEGRLCGVTGTTSKARRTLSSLSIQELPEAHVFRRRSHGGARGLPIPHGASQPWGRGDLPHSAARAAGAPGRRHLLAAQGGARRDYAVRRPPAAA